MNKQSHYLALTTTLVLWLITTTLTLPTVPSSYLPVSHDDEVDGDVQDEMHNHHSFEEIKGMTFKIIWLVNWWSDKNNNLIKLMLSGNSRGGDQCKDLIIIIIIIISFLSYQNRVRINVQWLCFMDKMHDLSISGYS